MVVPMTSLRRVQIRGFKSINELDLELGPLTVLIGANGAGKSNLVSFLNMLSSAMSGALQLWVGKGGGADTLLHYGAATTTRIEGELEFVADAATSAYSFALDHAADDALVFAEERVGIMCGEDSLRTDLRTLGTGHRESLLAQAADGGDRAAAAIRAAIGRWGCYHFHDTSPQAKVRLHHYIEDNGSLRDDGGNLAPLLYRLARTHPGHYERIVSTIRLVAPFFDDFVLEPSALNERQIMLRWQEHGRGMLFGPHLLSDGTLRFMALATLFLQPSELLPGLIVVDEPELGLHPYALRVIGDLMRLVADQSQVIISTQSADLVNCFGAEDIIVVDRQAGRSVFTRPHSAALDGWLAEYTLAELWEKNVIGGLPST